MFLICFFIAGTISVIEATASIEGTAMRKECAKKFLKNGAIANAKTKKTKKKQLQM